MPRLAEIAQSMIEDARGGGPVTANLSRGLVLTLLVAGGENTLTLSRADVAPGDREVAIIRQVFKIPIMARVSYTDRTVVIRWPSDGQT